METVELHGELRSGTGKGSARRTRMAGRTPGVIYGAGEQAIPITLLESDLTRVLRQHRGGTVVLDLKIAGIQDRDLTAIIKEVQREPVSRRVLHIDLQHVSLTQLVHVSVPVHLTGTAAGVKEGGILEQLIRDLEISCEAGRIPEKIDLDVTALVKGHSLHVSDLPLPEGVTSLTPADRVVATIITKAVEVAEAAAAPEAAAATPEGGAAPEKAAAE
ncbi:MAG: 50S ribosomal protein L25 [Candidatus Eisenbacteria bacterium]|nr:50S ribosomal protein L25 [Candidatus Eisenbacteria bacterium]